MRKATNKPVHSNETLATRAAVFYKRFTNIVIEHNIQKENIYNIDEIALFFDYKKCFTLEQRGRVVKIRENGSINRLNSS